MVRVLALLLREYRGTPARGVGVVATVESSTWCYRLLGVEGLRGLACESAVEALVVKFGCLCVGGRGCVWFRWRGGRGPCVRRARVGVASLRQLFSEFVLQGCGCRRARENGSGFAPRGSQLWLTAIWQSLYVGGTLRGAEIELF